MTPISGRVAEDVAFVADDAAAAAVAIVSVAAAVAAAVRDSCRSNNVAAAVDIFYANLRR